MMGTPSWKERKGVVALLGVLALVVWAGVAYTLAIGLAPIEEVNSQGLPAPSARSEVQRAAFVYAGDHRDPFAPQAVRSSAGNGAAAAGAPQGMTMDEALAVDVGADVEDEAAQAPLLPVPRLLGVAGATAVLEVPGEGTILAREGDWVGEAVVLRVGPTFVTLDFQGEGVIIELQ